jgi:hypothetical protein
MVYGFPTQDCEIAASSTVKVSGVPNISAAAPAGVKI